MTYKQDKKKKKLWSILLISILIISGLLTINFLDTNFQTAEAMSNWTQTSTQDFENGTSNNLTIIGNGEAAELQIELSDLYHWKDLTSPYSPNMRSDFSMATICTDDKVVIFGGYSNLDETWEYDLSNNSWIDKTPYPKPSNYPSGRRYHTMASIYGDDKAILFGGIDPWTIYKDDTWEYDSSNGSWVDRTKIIRPPRRTLAGMASIFGTDKVLLFGGSVGYSILSYFKDTWVYDSSDATWTNKTPSSIPTNYPHRRSYSQMESVYGTDKVVMFGGGYHDGSKYYCFNDTWIYDYTNDTWSNMTPIGVSPKARNFHRIASIQGDDKIVLFGGQNVTSYLFKDTWIYDLSDNTWTEVILRDPDIQPGYRASFGLAAIDGQDKIILFGGASFTSGRMRDTWIYTHTLPLRNGTYTSNPHDTGTKSDFKTLSWNSNIPTNTTLKFQARAGDNESDLVNRTFVGPDGAETSFYASSPTEIWSGHDGERWIQYKAYLNISVIKYSPSLKDITIAYNCLPTVTVASPIDNAILTTNNPTFNWLFLDIDSAKQKAFQVLIDDDNNFDDVTFDSGEQSSAIEFWEFPKGTSYTSLPDGIWYWKVRTQDEDDTWTDYSTPRTLIIDSQIPSSSPIFPINNGFYYNVSKICGIASDPVDGTGINKVEIFIKDINENTYWNGSNWVIFPNWILVKGTTNWIYDSSKIKWTSGNKYSIQSRAMDNATNIEEPTFMNIFTIDQHSPITNIEYPINDNWLNELNAISGSAIDISGSGLEKIELSIKCTKDYDDSDGGSKQDDYWDGAIWTSNKVWLQAMGTKKWSYDTTEIPWITGDFYTISSQAADKIDNLEIPSSGITFMYDAEPPENLEIFINNETEYTKSSEVILSLQAEDIGSGIYQMSFSTDSAIWSDWELFNTTRLFKLPGGDGIKTIYFKVRDYIGNIAEPISDSIILDITPPKGLSIIIEDNSKYTNSRQVKIELTATDRLSGIDGISFSNNGADWIEWVPFSGERIFTLPPDDGEKIVYFKVRDNVGNVAIPVYDSIILDTMPPHSLSIEINDGLSETNSSSVIIALNAIDDTSGINQISFSDDGEAWSAWEDYLNARSYELPAGNGHKTVYFKVKDNAENEAIPISTTIILNTTILEDEISTEKESSTGLDFWMMMFIIAIILFALIVIGLLIIIKRQARAEQRLLTGGGFGDHPVSLPGVVTPAAQMTKAVEQPQLPSTGAGPTTTPQPQLVESTQTVQTPPAQLTPQPSQVPQLPPVTGQTEKIKPEAKDDGLN